MRDVLRVRASGARDVEDTWQKYVPSARLAGSETTKYAFDWTSIGLDGFTFVDYELTADVRSAINPAGQLMACRVATRSGSVGNVDGALDVGMPWLAGEEGAHARWSGKAHVRAFVFDLGFAQRVARQISGDDRLRLRVHNAAPRSAGAAAHWERTYRHVGSSFAALVADGVDDPIIEADLRRQALAATLSTFSTTFISSLERSAQTSAAPATVRRAIAYMEAHAAEPVSIDDVAAAARISTRGLQYAFQRAVGTTPTLYLRDLRLAGAHDELRYGADGGVASIARRWGFASPSRFAAFYRERYGVNPSQTARS